MDKQTIIKNFSRYASVYDSYANIQKLTALKLLQITQGVNIKKALEIGCGSGNYTALLRDKFSAAELKAVDICEMMIRAAGRKLQDKGVEFIIADAESMDFGGGFDLVTSNACFQWFQDLEKALLKYKMMLNDDGLISFSLFGAQTLPELHAVLKEVFENTPTVTDAFLGREKLEQALRRNFKKFNIEEVKYEELFFSFKDLLSKIKYTGIRGDGIKGKQLFGRDLFNRMEKLYCERFSVVSEGEKQIKATYQVFFCRGQK